MVEHLSASQIGMFSRCGEQYRRRYIEGIKIPPGIAACLGRGVHKGAEHNYLNKLATRHDLPARIVKQRAVDEFEESVKKGIFLTQEEQSKKVELLDEARYKTEALSEVFVADIAPNVQPLHVECEVVLSPPEIYPVTVLGYLDVVAEGYVVRDLKTAGMKWSDDRVSAQLQTPVYAKMVEAEFGQAPGGFYYDVLVKTKAPYAQSLKAETGPDHWDSLMLRAQHMLAMIRAGNFPAADPGAWNCSPRWCGYWYSCRYIPASRRNTNPKTK